MCQLGYLLTGVLGLIGVCASGAWLAHIIVYMLPPIPIHPLLNDVFIRLDGVFPLFGVAAFAAFCAYLMGAVLGACLPPKTLLLFAKLGTGRMHDSLHSCALHGAARICVLAPTVVAVKGNFLLGLNLLIVSLYPIRVGATLMSSFLVNTALVLAMASAVIQFSASAFAAYAANTQIFDIFGSQARVWRMLHSPHVQIHMRVMVAQTASKNMSLHSMAVNMSLHNLLRPFSGLWYCVTLPAHVGCPTTQKMHKLSMQVMYLRGLRYIYQLNIFLYMMLGIMGISILAMLVRGPGKWKRPQRLDAYKF
jgi:hypothetical protein